MATTGDLSKLYTYTGLNDGQTYWIRVLVGDNAGNTGKSAEDNELGINITTIVANTAPKFTTQAWASGRSTSSLTISATATDSEQTSLIYTL